MPKQSDREIVDFLNVQLLKLIPVAKVKEYIRNIDDIYEKRAIRDHFSGQQFPKEILEILFYLYRESILSANNISDDNIVWWLSVSLKDKVLNDDHVNWLIQKRSTK